MRVAKSKLYDWLVASIVTLNVEPSIYLDNSVGIKVALEVSSLLKVG